jgi:ATP-dependent Clp protease ATP-binding subunit ClpA
MFERFTDAARAVVNNACAEARQLRHGHVGTEHLLLALAAEGPGIASAVLRGAGVRHADVRAEIERLVDPPPKVLDEADAAALRSIGIDLDAVLERIEQSLGADALLPPPAPRRGLLGRSYPGTRLTPRARKVLELALRDAIVLGHRHIGTEHILLGLIREGEGLAMKILVDGGVLPGGLRRAVLAALNRAA